MASEVQTNLRLPADLKDRLVIAADENNRSLSAEVALRLENSFKREEGVSVIDWMRLTGTLARLAVYIDERRQENGVDEGAARMASAIARADFEKILSTLAADLGVEPPDEPVRDFAMTLYRASLASLVARNPRLRKELNLASSESGES